MRHADRSPRPDPEEIAVRAFAYLADDPERLDRFLAMTGLTHATVREAAQSPAFLAAVAEHMARDDALLIAFATHSGLAPALIGAAMCSLAGMEGA